MKRFLFFTSMVLALVLVLTGCPNPASSGNEGGSSIKGGSGTFINPPQSSKPPKIEDVEFTLTVNLTGEDSESFHIYLLDRYYDFETASPRVQQSPATWKITTQSINGTASLKVAVFKDLNENGEFDFESESEFYLVSELDLDTKTKSKFDITLEIAEVEVDFFVPIDAEIFGLNDLEAYACLIGYGEDEYSGSLAGLGYKEYTVYALLKGNDVITAEVQLSGYKGGDCYALTPYKTVSAQVENYKATFDISFPDQEPDWLPIEKRISFEVTDQQSEYGFVKKGSSVCFIIPVEEGSDLSGDSLWNLFRKAEIGGDFDSVFDNWVLQNYEWKENIVDLVDYLEYREGITVFGKELLVIPSVFFDAILTFSDGDGTEYDFVIPSDKEGTVYADLGLESIMSLQYTSNIRADKIVIVEDYLEIQYSLEHGLVCYYNEGVYYFDNLNDVSDEVAYFIASAN